MNRKSKLTGVVLAMSAASVFALTPAVATAGHHHHGGSSVKCYGVNSCKGKGNCKTAQSSCKGKNSCKGKGWSKMSAKKCKKLGGSTEEAPADSQ